MFNMYGLNQTQVYVHVHIYDNIHVYTHAHMYVCTQPYTQLDAVGCPNKLNPFHECSSYCTERWGENVSAYYKRLCRLLKQYNYYICSTHVNVGPDKEHSNIASQLEASKR